MPKPNSHVSLIAKLPPDQRAEILASLTNEEAAALLYDWSFLARDNQLPPPGAWSVWMLLAGRGFGKTRTGAEFIRSKIESGQWGRVALVARTAADARDVMVEGEALALDTPIPTPDGWTTIADIKVGDYVFSRDGSVTRVVAVSPVWENRDCFALHADGADAIIADVKHQWVTSNRAERRKNRSRRGESVRSTDVVAATLKRRHDLYEHEIPMHGALQLPRVSLPIPPYTLGAWLGDGTTRGDGAFTCHDNDAETIEHIRADGFCVVPRVGSYAWGIHGLRALLRRANLTYSKHIPSIYLRASHEQRLALLQGLMDTDGYASSRGQCSFDNQNFALVEQVRELLLTLGFKPGAICKHEDKRGFDDMYRVTFMCGDATPLPFRLKRKVQRCVRGKLPNGRLIRAVEPVTASATKCIQVEHSSGTFLAGRDFVVTHNSGLLAVCPPWFKAEYEPSKRRITFPNGAIATTYSGDKPDQLRGPQHDGAWCDELAAWRYPEAWDMLQFGLRLGDHPQTVVTTTPRPTRLIRQLVNEPDTVLTTGSTYDNAANLPPQILEKFRRRYEGTRLGLQELYAKLLDDAPGALWKRSTIENSRVSTFPDLIRIAVAIDPAVSDGEESAETGIIAAGVSRNGHGFILDDATISGSPADWARQAISTYSLHRGDIIVAEVNNGGDMVENTIRTVRDAADNPIGRNIPFKQVRASRGKLTRAEPIAALYEQGRVHHVGVFSELEDQMCQWVPGDKSPDRLDAMVWVVTELMIDDAGELRLGTAPDALKDWFGA